MKAVTKMMGLVVASLLLPSAFAEPTVQREPIRIDFNKMIDANAGDKHDLEKTVTHKIDKRSAKKTTIASDKQKVLDFIDVEVNLSKERPLVDRRFNSVGEAKIAIIE